MLNLYNSIEFLANPANCAMIMISRLHTISFEVLILLLQHPKID